MFLLSRLFTLRSGSSISVGVSEVLLGGSYGKKRICSFWIRPFW